MHSALLSHLGSGASVVIPPFDPATISGIVAWYRADDLALADGTAVSSWTDNAGSPNHATQATGSKQPLYKTAILNGHAVVRFDGTDDYLRSALSLSQPDTTFMACKSIVGASGVRTFIDGNTNNRHIIRTVSNYEIFAGTAVVGNVAATTATRVIVGVFDGASSKIRVGGGAGATGNAGANGYGTALNIGCGGDEASFPASVDIGEIIVYNSVLTLTDINNVGGYLATKYGAVWTAAT